MPDSPYAPVFELTRGGLIESLHYGSIAVVDSHARLLAFYGDPLVVTYMRSSAKPLQLLSFLEEGGQEAYQLSDREIALMCASHSGTDEQVGVVRGIQEKTGVSEGDLLCGIHPLSDKPTILAMQERGEALTPNRHNCSGKHTGMLAYARMLGATLENYIDPEHPVQLKIRKVFSEMCGMSVEDVHIGIDGCSAPNLAIPLYNAALGIARLCDPRSAEPPMSKRRQEACHTITGAMLAYPGMVGGPDSFDTFLIAAGQGRVLTKGGAEGYQVIGLMKDALYPGSPGIGIAYKISDGDLKSRLPSSRGSRGHVRPAVGLEVLKQLGASTEEMQNSLADFGPAFPLHNWQGLLVGEGHPCFHLRFETSTASRFPSYVEP